MMQSRPLPPDPNDPPPHVILEAKLDEILTVLKTISEALRSTTETTNTEGTEDTE